jgi:hypothetical protein
MARVAKILAGVAGGFMVFVPDALAMHDVGHRTVSTSSVPWDTIGLWSGIGVAIVLVVVWLAFEGRRHHLLPPHRPVHT